MDVDSSLVKRIQEQLERLVEQLSEIESERESSTLEEYEELRHETMEQLKELERTLENLECGNVSLLDEIATTRTAIRNAVSEAFKTPEVIALFARKRPAQLRERLMLIGSQFKMHKITENVYKAQKVEILNALVQLKEVLTEDEKSLLAKYNSSPSFHLQQAGGNRTFQGDV